MDRKSILLEQIRKSSKVIKWVYLITVILLAAILIILTCMLFDIGSIGLMESFVSAFWEKMTQDYQSMGFLTRLMYLNLSERMFRTVFIVRMMAELVLYVYMIVRVYGVFRDVAATGKPFDAGNARSIKTIVWIQIIIALLDRPVRGLVTGLIMWCLYRMFEYGCLLQSESDDTV